MSAIRKLIDALHSSDHGPYLTDLADAAEAELAGIRQVIVDQTRRLFEMQEQLAERVRADAELLEAVRMCAAEPFSMTRPSVIDVLQRWAAAKGGAH